MSVHPPQVSTLSHCNTECCVLAAVWSVQGLSNGSLHLTVRSPMSPNTSGPANSEGRWSYSEHERVVSVNHGSPIHAAKHVLGDFWDQFIADMDANTVVWELLHKDIIPRGVQERISRTDEPKQKNEIIPRLASDYVPQKGFDRRLRHNCVSEGPSKDARIG